MQLYVCKIMHRTLLRCNPSVNFADYPRTCQSDYHPSLENIYYLNLAAELRDVWRARANYSMRIERGGFKVNVRYFQVKSTLVARFLHNIVRRERRQRSQSHVKSLYFMMQLEPSLSIAALHRLYNAGISLNRCGKGVVINM